MDSLLLIYDGEQFLELFAGWSLAAVLLPNCKLGQVRQRYESLDLAGGLLAGPCAGGLLTKYQSRC